jgi:hypothetical protein
VIQLSAASVRIIPVARVGNKPSGLIEPCRLVELIREQRAGSCLRVLQVDTVVLKELNVGCGLRGLYVAVSQRIGRAFRDSEQ